MNPAKLRTPALALVLAVILFVTLEPLPGPPRPIDLSLYSGLRAVADGVLNVLLFVPLGMTLAWRFRGALRLVALGAALSLAVEVAQIWLPGRDPSLSDLLSNSLGTAVGVVLVRRLSSLLAFPWRFPRAWAAAWLALVVAGLAVAGALLRPQWPAGRWLVRWGTSTEVAAPFAGRVREATLGRVALWPGLLSSARTGEARAALEEGLPFRATAVLPARPASGVAGVVGIAAGPAEVAMLGVAGSSVVFRFRTLSSRWHLDQPDLRLGGALRGGAWPRTVHLAAWRQGGRYCIAAGGRSDCDLGFTLGDTRSELVDFGASPGWLRRLLGALWLGLVFAPAGLTLRRWPERVVLGVAIGLVLLVLPRLTGLIPTPPEDYPAALAGILAGAAWTSGWARRHPAPPPAPRRSARSGRS